MWFRAYITPINHGNDTNTPRRAPNRSAAYEKVYIGAKYPQGEHILRHNNSTVPPTRQ